MTWLSTVKTGPRLYASIFILIFFALATQTVQAQPTLLENGFQLEQVDFEMTATGTVRNSEYGHVTMQITPDPELPYFVNVVGQLEGQEAGWLVQNMPIFPQSAYGDSPVPVSTTVNLELIGVERGQNASDSDLTYDLNFTQRPVEEAPSLDNPRQTTIGQRVYDAGGETGEAEAPPQLPRFVERVDMPDLGDGENQMEIVGRPGMGNVEQATNQCGPAGIANSMRWLAKVYESIDLCGETEAQTVSKLDSDTGRTGNNGIGQAAAIRGKLKYANRSEHRLPIDIHYQADSSLTDLGASVTEGGVTAKRDGTGGKPTWAYLYQEMKKGQDVELSIDWLDNAGNKTGGHVVAVSGAAQWGGLKGLATNDDGDQGDAGGLRTNHTHIVTVVNGYLQLNGFGSKNRVKAIYSESPRKDAVSTPCTCEAAVVKTTDSDNPDNVNYELICAGSCEDSDDDCERVVSTDHHGARRVSCSCDDDEQSGCRLVLYTPGLTRGGGDRTPEVFCAGSCPDGRSCRKITTKEGDNRELIRCSCEEEDEARDESSQTDGAALRNSIPDGARILTFTTVDEQKREPNIGGKMAINRPVTGGVHQITFLAVDGEQKTAEEAGVELEEEEERLVMDIPNESRIAAILVTGGAGTWALLGDGGSAQAIPDLPRSIAQLPQPEQPLPLPPQAEQPLPLPPQAEQPLPLPPQSEQPLPLPPSSDPSTMLQAASPMPPVEPGPDGITPVDGAFDIEQGTFEETITVPKGAATIETEMNEMQLTGGGSDQVTPVAIRESEAGTELAIQGQGAAMAPDGTMDVTIENPEGQVFEGQVEGIGYQLHVPPVHQRGAQVPVTLTLMGTLPDQQFMLNFYPTPEQTITPQQVMINGGQNGAAMQIATLTTQQLGPQAFGFELFAVSPDAAVPEQDMPAQNDDAAKSDPEAPDPLNPSKETAPQVPEPMNPPGAND